MAYLFAFLSFRQGSGRKLRSWRCLWAAAAATTSATAPAATSFATTARSTPTAIVAAVLRDVRGVVRRRKVIPRSCSNPGITFDELGGSVGVRDGRLSFEFSVPPP